jgi:hypothetical protein
VSVLGRITESEGPCPLKPGQLAKFHDATEFKSKDERVFTSNMLGEDGKWILIIRVTSKRVSHGSN